MSTDDLAPLQRRILQTLARYGETTLIELADFSLPAGYPSVDLHPDDVPPGCAWVGPPPPAADEDDFHDVAAAVRRAVQRLRERGLVEETKLRTTWCWTGHRTDFHRVKELAAARLTPAGKALLATIGASAKRSQA
jgi:hypothetical protein